MSDRERWGRLKQMFEAALAQPADARDAWLERACAGDSALQQEAAALLRSLDTAGGFLEEPAAFAPDELLVFAPGTRLGSYEILAEIGRGGMGIVYVAEDIRLGRRVAVKALPSDLAANPELRQRLRREARAAATVAHPNVATIYALEELDDQLLIVSEHVAGQTLRALLAGGPLETDRVRAIAVQIAGALAAAHDAGVVHRDLKPENVLITPTGDVKVVDFGIAHVEGPEATRLTRAGALLGTPAYMAPEQLLGQGVDARADIYALGVMVSEMLTGRHPLAQRTTPPAPVDAQLAGIAARCMQSDPELRFPTARDAAAALSRAAVLPTAPHAPEAASPPSTAHRPPATSARFWWEFHQATAAVLYWIMVVPAWQARALIGGSAGRLFFIATLASIVVAANLRLNLWFTSRFYPSELRWARRRVGRWIRAGDWLFVIALAAGGVAIGEERSPLAAVLIGFAIGATVAFLFIERVTTRAAFSRQTGVN